MKSLIISYNLCLLAYCHGKNQPVLFLTDKHREGKDLKLFTCHLSPERPFTSQYFSVYSSAARGDSFITSSKGTGHKESCGNERDPVPGTSRPSRWLGLTDWKILGKWKAPEDEGWVFSLSPQQQLVWFTLLTWLSHSLDVHLIPTILTAQSVWIT